MIGILVDIILIFLILRTLVVIFNAVTTHYLPTGGQVVGPKVSILIPARNEEKTIANLLQDLSQSEYLNLEVIVCDDHSEDKTVEVVRSFSPGMPGLKYFSKIELPDGWGGKNHACHELAKQATGDYLLFVDADVRLSPDAIGRAVLWMEKEQTALLSVFPEQIIETEGEWRTVPIMNRILLSFLPLRLVRWKRFSSLSAANGQFMMFESDNYRRYNWHDLVRNELVEDIVIARKMKQEGHRIAVLLGRNDVACRMYSSENEAIKGFSRNIHQYFGGSGWWLALYVILSWTRLPLLFLAGFFLEAILSVFMIGIIVGLSSGMSRQSGLRNGLLLIHQQIALSRIWLRNVSARMSGVTEWKGRIVSVEKK